MEALAVAEEELKKTEATLSKANAKLQQVKDGLLLLQTKFEVEQEKKQKLELERQLCEERMSRAVRLVGGLADEKIRWALTVAQLKNSLPKIVGDILLSAGKIIIHCYFLFLPFFFFFFFLDSCTSSCIILFVYN